MMSIKGYIVATLLTVFSGFGFQTFSQNMKVENRKSRIDFRELLNKQGNQIPSLLIKAFCAGDIQAYYPNSPSTPLDYNDFLSYFGMPVSTPLAENDNTIPCIQQSCMNMDPWTLGCFSVYMDMDYDLGFNNKKSAKTRRINYIRLVYASECNAMNLDYYGPVFKMKDIKSLGQKYTLTNLANKASSKTIYDFFALGLYNDTVFEINGQLVENPARQNHELDRKQIDSEGTLWEN